MKKSLFVASIALAALQSCGTIVNGPSQRIMVTSHPPQGAVRVDGAFRGYTPTAVKLTRRDCHTVRIEVPGYEPYEIAFTPSISGWAIGNLAFGGVLGVAVDAMSGGLYKLSPDQVHADLIAGQQLATLTSAQGAVTVKVVTQADPQWEQVGQLSSSSPQELAASL